MTRTYAFGNVREMEERIDKATLAWNKIRSMQYSLMACVVTFTRGSQNGDSSRVGDFEFTKAFAIAYQPLQIISMHCREPCSFQRAGGRACNATGLFQLGLVDIVIEGFVRDFLACDIVAGHGDIAVGVA